MLRTMQRVAAGKGSSLRRTTYFAYCRFAATTPEAQAAASSGSKPQPKARSVSEAKVAFAVGRSAELTAKVAAMEAFDLAAAALPRAPNFCVVNVSIDCVDMVDCLPIVWSALERVNQLGTAAGSSGATRTTSEATKDGSVQEKSPAAAAGAVGSPKSGSNGGSMVMLGSAVRDQRLAGSFCEVLLGCVPDLRLTTFTLDKVPEVVDPALPSAVLGVAMIDWRLAVNHHRDVNDRLDATSRLLNTISKNRAPLVGAVLPPAEPTASTAAGAAETSTSQQASDALFCINDNVYRGSAAIAVLHSNLLAVDALTATPCNAIPGFEASLVVTEGSLDGVSLTWTISQLDGRPATDVIREVYEGSFLKERVASRMFLAVHLPDAGMWCSLTFRGVPDVQSIIASLPPAVFRSLSRRPASAGQPSVKLVCDARQLDTPALASALLGYEKHRLDVDAPEGSPSAGFVRERQRVMVHREQPRDVVAANAAMLHWFHPGLYEIMSADPALSPDGNIVIRQTKDEGRHVPSIATRCLGASIPVAGVCTPGQIGPFVGGPVDPQAPADQPAPSFSCIGARCASHVVLREASPPSVSH